MLRNFKMLLAYDGTRYDGWQKQENTDRTVQGRLESVLSELLAQPITVQGSGRTDAGVHAWGQVANFRAETALSPEALLRRIRAALPESIGLRAIEEAEPRFHSRLNAVGKRYVYRIWNSETPCVFSRRYVWRLPGALDLDAMREAAALLCGRHDFRSFCSNRQMKKSTVRTLESIEIRREGEELRLFFAGEGFLYNMVRILTGTLVEIGQGKRSPAEIPAMLEAKNRAAAGMTAPACGLILQEVLY